jgi:hypothetical protein
MQCGVYGDVVFRALQASSPGPWEQSDLSALPGVITEEFCAEYGHDCHPREILDWVESLSSEELLDLLGDCNKARTGNSQT